MSGKDPINGDDDITIISYDLASRRKAELSRLKFKAVIMVITILSNLVLHKICVIIHPVSHDKFDFKEEESVGRASGLAMSGPILREMCGCI